jgi:glycosyltransferase involved in cell wall biosynthesis
MRVGYVLGTSDGGTQRHVRMLADGLAARGVTVSVYGPAATWTAAAPHPAAAAPAPARADAVGDVSAETPPGAAGAGSAGARAGAAGDVSAETPSGAGDAPAEAPGRPGPPRFAAVEIADRPRPSRDLAAIRRLRALLAGSRPDVVHAHGLRAGALAALAAGGATDRAGSGRAGSGRAGSGRAGSGRARSGRTRSDRAGAGRQGARRGRARSALVVTVHNAPPANGPAAAVYRALERLVARRADTVLCVSGDLEARMRRLGTRRVARALVPASPAPTASPAPAGVSLETRAGLQAELGLAGDPAAPLILTVARLAPQKGLGTLIEAAAGWRDRDPVPLLLIAGSGPLLADLTRSAEAGRVRVRFLGRRDDVPALLAAADVVVLPSAWEGQPLIVQETLRAGRPLVASRVGGIPDLTGEDSALLVPAGDAQALSAAVLSVLDDPVLAERLSEAALQRSRSLPSEQDALDAALAEYCRVAPPASQ